MKVQPVYHIGVLERYRDSKAITREQTTLEVESRRNRPKKHNPIEYLVLWEGYPEEDGTWEVYDNLKGTADELLQGFHRRYPKAVKDMRMSA